MSSAAAASPAVASSSKRAAPTTPATPAANKRARTDMSEAPEDDDEPINEEDMDDESKAKAARREARVSVLCRSAEKHTSIHSKTHTHSRQSATASRRRGPATNARPTSAGSKLVSSSSRTRTVHCARAAPPPRLPARPASLPPQTRSSRSLPTSVSHPRLSAPAAVSTSPPSPRLPPTSTLRTLSLASPPLFPT